MAKQIEKSEIALRIRSLAKSILFRKPSIISFTVLERSGAFHFCVPVEAGFMCGDFATLFTKREMFLGRVDTTSFNFLQERQDRDISFGTLPVLGLPPLETVGIVSTGYYLGNGQILAEIQDSGVDVEFDHDNCVGDASMGSAVSDVVESYLAASCSGKKPLLYVGTLLNIESPIRARLIVDGFKRHTGLFGQSGSGKSFALGIILEELHLSTGANIIVLDFNGDFVRLKRPLRKIEEINHSRNKYTFSRNEIKKYQELHTKKKNSIRIVSANQGRDVEPIVIRFCDLSEEQKSLLLKIDPLQNWQLFRALSQVLEKLREEKLEYSINDLLSKAEESDERLYQRIKSLALEKTRIWGNSEGDEIPLLNLIGQDDLQTIIIDLSTLTGIERSIICSIVFKRVWELQEARKTESLDIHWCP